MAKTKIEPRQDYRGNPLEIGDEVHFSSTNRGYLDGGKIISFSNKGAGIETWDGGYENRCFAKIGKINVRTPLKNLIKKVKEEKNERL